MTNSRRLLTRLATCGVVMLASLAACNARRPPSSPNLLLVTFDTTRADRIGCYGFPLARTATVDRMAKEGVRFANHATVAPITLPAHASILTGLYPPAHGVRDNGAYALGDEVSTLAERLKAQGYDTRAFVSAAVLDHRYNLSKGFDAYDDDLWAEDDPLLFMIRDRPAPRTAARVVAWLDEWKATRRPFFAWVHFFDPHQPYKPHARLAYLSPSAYDAEIASADEGFATIVAKLEALGALDDTLVVMTADHGESLGEHEEKTHGLFIYQATIHVPLVMRYPPRLPAGVTYEGPSRAVDVLPTALAVLGVSGGAPVQGESLLPAIRGEVPPPASPQYSESLLAEVGFGMAPLYGLRRGNLEYVRAPRPELYRLDVDPRESNNLYAGEPQTAAELDQELDRVLADSAGHAKVARRSPMDRETQEMLQALGYLAPAATREGMRGIDPKDGIGQYNDLEAARHAAQRGNWSLARRLLEELLVKTPTNVSARNILALAYQHEDDPGRARQEYARSLAVDPGQYRVHAMLAQMELEKGDLNLAEAHLARVLEMMPQFAEALLLSGYIEARRGHTARAEEWFAQALRMDPTAVSSFRRLGDLEFVREAYPTALAYYERLLSQTPVHYAALIQAGLAAAHAGDPGKSEAYLELALELRPDAWLPLFNAAWAQSLAGGLPRATDLLWEAVGAGFSHPEVLEREDDWAALRATPAYEAIRLAAYENARREATSRPASKSRRHE